ncbi:MAG: hypothetical protein ABTD50_16630 [Polyangiaceae bacterium]
MKLPSYASWPCYGLLAFGACSLSSCAPSGFASENLIDSVRIMASSVRTPDSPYVAPGAQVTVDVLADDGRATQSPTMTLWWFPYPCINPENDAYYNCFPQFAALAGMASPGQNLSSILPSGQETTFTMPADAVTTHPQTPGTPVVDGVPAYYGLAILFNFACAGQLELLPIDPNDNNPQALPMGCFDSQHNQLGPEDFVFGFTTVYAYDPTMLAALSNTNPVIQSIDFDGTSLTPGPAGPGGVTYAAPAMNACSASGCPTHKIGPIVPASSWELNPEAFDDNGNPLHEELWADFYVTVGNLDSDARLLYDSTTGSIGGPSDTDNTFTPPSSSGPATLWIVVHDSRAGATWATVTLTIN